MNDRLHDYIIKNGFINGIYVPWFHGKWFHRDIGKSIVDNYAESMFNLNYVKKVLYNCKGMGFDMVKFWMNEDFEGMLFDEKGSVIGIEPTFIKNLETILNYTKEIDLKVALCVVVHNECNFTDNKFKYDKYMRFIQIESETEKYIKNWLTPLLLLVKKYDNVMLIDTYAEPEADGGIWNVLRGISWNRMVAFINSIHYAVKEILPDMATTVSSGSSCSTLIEGRYNDVKVDYLGADIYSDNAGFSDPRDMLIDRPFMLGEYGIASYRTASNDDQVAIVSKFFSRLVDTRAAGAFYWCYGWDCTGAGEMHLVDKTGNLRKVAAYIHFYNLDRVNNRTGNKSPDIPRMIVTDTSDNVQWFAARGAQKYVLESYKNGAWKTVNEFIAEEYTDYPDIYHFSNENAAQNEQYRIKAVYPNGSEYCSESIQY